MVKHRVFCRKAFGGMGGNFALEQVATLQGIRNEMATELIYLALRNITAKWKNPPREWHAAKAQFAIQFGERIVLTV